MTVARVLIMAGGTGGHVYPALAVGQLLRAEGADVLWMGTKQGLESQVVPRAGIPLETVSVSGLRGKGVLSWLMAPLRLTVALLQSLIIIMRFRPMAVLGMGGFVSGPGGFMSWLLRRPLLIHEQNAVAGLTNRLLCRLASRTMSAFPRAFPARIDTVVTGNPVREDIASLAPPEVRLRDRKGPLRLLVLGGSLGATALNQGVPEAVAGLAVCVRHQCGRATAAEVVDAYVGRGTEATVTPFIEDMADAYAWADLVVCRAGALTLTELAAAGVAAILVPFPFAVDDHQTKNARFLVEAGAALLLPQSGSFAADLRGHLQKFFLLDRRGSDATAAGGPSPDRATLLRMAAAARRLAIPDAALRVSGLCLELARG